MKDTLRNYRNTIVLNFKEKSSGFTLDVPHHDKWLDIIMFLSNRCFKITKNQYYEKEYNVLSPFHKIGFKKDITCLMAISGGSIQVEFGNIQNLWKDMPQSFWNSPSDDRYTKLSYLENKAVELETKKLIDFCKGYDLELQIEDSNLPPEEYIIASLKNNTHIHGVVNSLNDIKVSMKENSYDYLHNSNDKNKKKIICGDIKYFYHPYTNRLSFGIAWHHINNMWWVITGGQKYNLACFYLFDYDPSLPKRKPVSESKITSLLKRFESKRDYKRCLMIKEYSDKLFSKVA